MSPDKIIKTSSFIAATLFCMSAYSQNIFPASGNVGIGTTVPVDKFEVVGGNVSATIDTSFSGFVQLWNDNAIIWKRGNINGGLRFGSATNLWANGWSETMRILDNGNVGIGTGSASAKLEIAGNVKAQGLIIPTNAANGKVLTSDANGNATWQTAAGGTGSSNWTINGADIFNANAGFVGIGTSVNPMPLDTKLKLAVSGNIIAQKLKITQTGWADYVFDPAYKLRTLKEVEKFIQKNNHLPEIPSAAEVEKQGIDVGDSQALLLKKIEELTLYIIDLNKKVDAQQKEIQALKK